METLKSFLNTITDVVLVANDKLEGNPLVTPIMDKATGNPKTDLLGNELGSIRLEQSVRSLTGSYLNNRRRVAFIGGTLEELNALLAANNLKAGSKLPGKIIITESLNPLWKGQDPKMNPQTAEVISVTVGDKPYPVYMKMTYTENMNAVDTFLRTPEDVLAWLNNQRTLEAITNQEKTEGAGVPQ